MLFLSASTVSGRRPAYRSAVLALQLRFEMSLGKIPVSSLSCHMTRIGMYLKVGVGYSSTFTFPMEVAKPCFVVSV